MSKKIDLDSKTTEHRGAKGVLEAFLRKFRAFAHVTSMVPVYLFAGFFLGTCFWPGVTLVRFTIAHMVSSPWWLQNFAYASSFVFAYLLYGFSLIFLAPILNRFLGRVTEWRGPYYSAESFKWFLHNGLTYLARYTFLEFVTPSPVGVLFYKMMGMKIGRGTIINSTWISDPSMIELGEKVTIGGSVTLVAHYGQGGLLVIAPVKIGDRCTIGLKATVMGGAEIGADAKIMPHSVVLPKTIIPAGETWGGVPAQKIENTKTVIKASA